MKPRPIHSLVLFTALLLSGALAGCDTSEATPPIDKNGQIQLPEGIKEGQQAQRARFLEAEKKNRLQGGR